VINEPKFFFLTAFRTKQFMLYVESLGVEDVLEKPIQETKLSEIVDLVTVGWR